MAALDLCSINSTFSVPMLLAKSPEQALVAAGSMDFATWRLWVQSLRLPAPGFGCQWVAVYLWASGPPGGTSFGVPNRCPKMTVVFCRVRCPRYMAMCSVKR